MIVDNKPQSIDGFVLPGRISISPSALKMAKDFYGAVKGSQGKDWVVAFDWAESIVIRRGPNDPAEDVGACLTLGAYERHQIPVGVSQTNDGIEFVIKIPDAIWKGSVRRLIDLDEKMLFRLTLL